MTGKEIAEALAARIALAGIYTNVVQKWDWWICQVGLTNGVPPHPTHHIAFRPDGSPVGFINGKVENPWRGGPCHDAYRDVVEGRAP